MSNLHEHFQAAIVPVKVIDAHPSNIGRELGDLRDLAASIREHGVRVPVILEKRAGRYRLRDGHRRVAAAQQAGIKRVPAILHAEALDDREWLLEAVDYNLNRRGYTPADLKLVAGQLLDLGVTRAGVAAAFHMSTTKLGELLDGPKPKPDQPKRPPTTVSVKTLRRLLEQWRAADRSTILAELEQLLTPPRPTAAPSAGHTAAPVEVADE